MASPLCIRDLEPWWANVMAKKSTCNLAINPEKYLKQKIMMSILLPIHLLSHRKLEQSIVLDWVHLTPFLSWIRLLHVKGCNQVYIYYLVCIWYFLKICKDLMLGPKRKFIGTWIKLHFSGEVTMNGQFL